MARPKGSKNKKTIAAEVDNQITLSTALIDEQISAVEAEIADLTQTLRSKKAELKTLTKEKVRAEELEARQRAEADKEKLLDAVAKSGKSIDEILELLK